MSIKPKLFLDTNVCDSLRDPSFGESRRRIKNKHRIVVSPNTMIELLDAVAAAKTDEHFEIRRDRMRIMTGDGKPTFLPFPGQFALRKALNINEKPTFDLGKCAVKHIG
jgi:hypothetical protein